MPLIFDTHIAEIEEIRPYQDTGKYQVIFKGPARPIGPITSGELKYRSRDRPMFRVKSCPQPKRLRMC
ncbi:MAG: hypothetical protein WC076_05235 [Terrimicrobiaceae bacterium]|jgi:hypothetical protein|nr:hypothetical protein [Terrimicrobiaceae bacterium]